MFGESAVLLERRRMGGRGGRPKGDQEARTQLVRIDDDLADMVSWIVKVGASESSAVLLGPMIREKLTAIYNSHLPQIKRLQAAADALKKTAAEVRAEIEVKEAVPPKRKRPE